MSRIPRSVVVWLTALTVLRLVIATLVPLGDDETFYWEWSRHLAAGYVDHPPAIAVLIWATTHLWGATPLGVRAAAVLLSWATSLGVWVLAHEVLGSRAGATWSVVLFNIIPVFSAGALLAAPDAPLGLCWVLALLWAWRAARSEDGRAWLWAGAWLGLGLDSKYTAAVLPPSLGLWLALSPRRRRWLLRPEPYLGLLLSAALFAPVVWWNATHRWASFSTTLLGRPSWAEGGNFPEFVGFQLVYLAPLMLPALLWALAVACRRSLRPAWGPAGRPALPPGPRDGGDGDRWPFLAAVSVPLIAGMFALSLAGHIKGHWPAPGYITAAVALAGLGTELPWMERPPLARATAAAVLGSTALVTGLIHTLPVLAPLLLPPRLDPTVDYYGWPQAARQIAAVARREAHGPFFVTTDRYQVMAQFDFATGGRYPSATITGDDQYALWTRWDRLRGEDALFIEDGRYPPEVELREGCRSVQAGPAVPVVRRGVTVRVFRLLWCRGFLGAPVGHLTPPR
jgi:dolichol-phosphate mannosyltransferase